MSKHLLSLVALVCLAVPATGCVKKSTYTDLESAYAASKAEMGARIAELEGEVAALEKTLATERELNAERIAGLEWRLSEANDRIADLELDAAQLLADRSNLESSVADMTEALRELERRRLAAERRVAAFRDMLERFQRLIDAGTLQVKIVDGRMVVQLKTDILFASGSASLSGDGKAALEEVAAVLQSIPERSYQVEGHTDDVPIATAQYPSNWELASGRALTVVKTMIAAGLAPDRVSAASFGEFKPAADNDSDDGRAQNRRIEIVVVPDLSDLPGFEELQQLSE